MKKTLPTFVQEYFDEHPDFLNAVEQLEQKRQLKLLNKLYSDRNEINFYSWISEVHYGLFFDGYCNQLFYDKLLEGKKPDWTLQQHGQTIIAEVLRINVEEQELHRLLQFEKGVKQFQKENPGVPLVINYGAKCLRSDYFYQAQSKLEQKAKNYQQIIEQHQLPFLICITPIQSTYIRGLDTYDFLIGNNRKGFFYQDDLFGKYVSGVWLKTPWNEWIYFHNEKAQYQLTEINRKTWEPFFYQENK